MTFWAESICRREKDSLTLQKEYLESNSGNIEVYEENKRWNTVTFKRNNETSWEKHLPASGDQCKKIDWVSNPY